MQELLLTLKRIDLDKFFPVKNNLKDTGLYRAHEPTKN